MSTAEIEVEWTRGGRGAIVASDGKLVTAESDTAAAPGTPLSGFATDGVRYEVKVRSCKRISAEPTRYRIEGRFMNLSARDREALLSVLGSQRD
jgi:hypothetical protein